MTLPVKPYQRDFNATSKRILVTGTRSTFSLELCRQFRHSGHRVYAADSTKAHLARGSTYVTRSFLVPPPNSQLAEFARQLNRIVEDERIDIVVPTSEEIFHMARVRAQLSDRCTWFLPTLPVLRRLHNKYEFIQWVKELGFPVPQTELITENSQLDTITRRISDGEELVLKPAFSRFSSKTLIRPKSAEEVYSMVGSASVTSPWVSQEYMPGRQISSYSISQKGQLKAYSDYATTFSINRGVSIHFECIQHPAVYEFVSSFLQRTGFSGQIAFDFIEAEDGSVMPIECNPRTTSGVHLFRLGTGLPTCFMGEQSSPLIPPAGTRAQIATAMLLFGWSNPGKSAGTWLRHLLTSGDVIFSWRDPIPLFWLIVEFIGNRVLAYRKGISAPAASTLDFEWNGEE